MAVLVVRVDEDEVEACSDWLWQLGATAIEERPLVRGRDADPIDLTAGAGVELIAGFGDDDAALGARSLLIERWPSRLESTGDEAAWRDEWLRWIEPVSVAGFGFMHPGMTPRPGQQTHRRSRSIRVRPLVRVTTRPPSWPWKRSRVIRSGDRVLDAGCGTGILSIAAAKLGAELVTGVDLDHDILEVAAANIEANHVAGAVQLLSDPVDRLGDGFDVVVANIVIGDLAPLVPALVERAERVVVLSGFLDEQFERLLDGIDVRVLERTSADGWGCAALTPIL